MYGGSAGSPQSGRVVRLENVGGMLQVVYDGTAPNMAIQSGGVVRRVSGTTGGMIEIDYAPPRR
jgi:hypothetical protein